MRNAEPDFYYFPKHDHCWLEAASLSGERWLRSNYSATGRTVRWAEFPMIVRAVHEEGFRLASGPAPERLHDYADQMEVLRCVQADRAEGNRQVALETLVALRADAIASPDPRSQRVVKPEVERAMQQLLSRALGAPHAGSPHAPDKTGLIASIRRTVHQLDTTLLRVAASIVLALELIRIIRSIA